MIPANRDRRFDPRQGRGLTAIDAAAALVVILLAIQMWLLTATLDAYLGGHVETALPAAIASGVLFAACAGLYGFVQRLDRNARSNR